MTRGSKPSHDLAEAQEQAAARKADATTAREKAFSDHCYRLDHGEMLSFDAIGRVYGHEFYMLLIHALMDANDAARAISGAIRRLKNETTSSNQG